MLRLCPAWRRWLPPFLGAVTIPALISRRDPAARVGGAAAKEPEEARFVLERRLHSASRLLSRTRSPGASSRYMETERIYSPAEWATKERAVTETLDRYRPSNVLDIGCNTGFFSRVAARTGASVVAIDQDPEALGEAWKTAEAEGLAILPLVVNLARPPGGCGWSNDEFAGFLERARGKFEGVLMLALLHHLVVNERVPIESIFDLAASLTTRLLVLEYVDPADPQFRRISRGRDALYRDLTVDTFEMSARRRFDIADARTLTPTRRIYTLEKRRR